MADKPERQKRKTTGNTRQGFRLTHSSTDSEEMQREKEHENVKVHTFYHNILLRIIVFNNTEEHLMISSHTYNNHIYTMFFVRVVHCY